MRVRPKGGGASKQVADMIEGHLRDIEQQSEAEIAYTIALDQAVGQGLGYFRLVREYEDERSFQQVLRIRSDLQPLRRVLRPCQRAPGGPRPGVGLHYRPLAHVQVYAVVRGSPQELTLFCGHGDDLATDAQVQLAEYYYKTYETQELVQFPNGRCCPRRA